MIVALALSSKMFSSARCRGDNSLFCTPALVNCSLQQQILTMPAIFFRVQTAACHSHIKCIISYTETLAMFFMPWEQRTDSFLHREQHTAWWPVDLVKTFLVTMAEYRLSTSQTILLIELYHCHDALWDFTNPLYKDRNVKSKSYQSMQMAFRDETGITLPGERAHYN